MVIIDALPCIDHDYDEPGVRVAALGMVEEENWRSELDLTYSPRSFGFLIMLDSPRLLLLLSTWSFFVLDGLRGSS